MKNIHWLGSGLSSIPGIRRLASNNYSLTVWNRTLSKAQKSIDHVKTDKISAKTFNMAKSIFCFFNALGLSTPTFSAYSKSS